MKQWVRDTLLALEKQSKILLTISGVVLVILIGLLDFLTGYELGLSLLYLAPISLVVWFIGKKAGVVISFICAFTWLLADIASSHINSLNVIYVWNAGIRFDFFIIVTLLLSKIRSSLHQEQELSRTDYLTGAVNRRFFMDTLEREIHIANRYNRPFTIAYIDIDNFKLINDRFGHRVGDQILKIIVENIKQKVRKTDVIGRLGGDEFILLLPETGLEASRVVIDKLYNSLVHNLEKIDSAVTFSIGVVTCLDPPKKIDELINLADQLMYSVKNGGKDGVAYSSYPSQLWDESGNKLAS